MRDDGAGWARLAATALLTLAGLQLLFLLLVTAGAAVPDRAVVAAMRSGVDAGLLAEEYPPDGVGGRLDGHTECLAFSVGLPSEAPLFHEALQAPYAAGCANLQAWLEGDDAAGTGLYFRYWHGYTLLTRPALALGGVVTVRALTFLLLGAATVWFLVALARATGMPTALLAFAPLALSTNVLLTPLATTQGLSTAAALAGAAAATEAARRGAHAAIAVCALAAGGVFVWVDLLTTPPVAWMLAVFGVAAATWHRFGSLSETTLRGLLAAAAWSAGYAATWVAKWLLTMLSLPADRVLRDVVEVVAFRVGAGQPDMARRLGAATGANLRLWIATAGTARAVLVLVTLATLATITAALVRRRSDALLVGVILVLPALLTPVWYEVMSNHSRIHAFFTYRNLAASAGVVAAAAYLTWRAATAGPPGAHATGSRPAPAPGAPPADRA